MNISSPFKENVYKDNAANSPFAKNFLSPFYSRLMYQGSPLLKNTYWPQINTPGSNFGIPDHVTDLNPLSSPFLGIKSRFEFDTPWKSHVNQA